MDITMIGLQNAGKTSLLRVLAVSHDVDGVFLFHC
jgi:GTPase SAR1 family protein